MSTLHVENLKGLSSGGNANKIIVPSGQTLSASNGHVMLLLVMLFNMHKRKPTPLQLYLLVQMQIF